MKPSIERRLQLFGGRRIWRTVVADEDSGPGGSQNLAQVLSTGNDAGGAQAKNLADGTDPQDAATVSQLGAGSGPDVSDGGTTNVIAAPELIEFPNATVDEPSPGVARVITNGGSQPGAVRRRTVDVTAADLAEGPITLYTPDAGEVVGPVYLYDVVFCTHSNAITVGRDEQVAGDSRFPALAAWDTTLTFDGAGMAAAAAGSTGGKTVRQIPLTTGSVTAGFTNGGTVDSPQADAWEAGHVYAQFDVIIAAGHLWYADPGGTSGGTKPDFAANIGGTVTDGPDIVWNDSADATAGSATISFDVCTPEAL